MNRTTELLKGCGAELEMNLGKCGQDLNDGEGIWLCSDCQSELKGRLDVLKEEVEFLKGWIKYSKDKYFRNNAFGEAENRILLIQKEIKQIEESQ